MDSSEQSPFPRGPVRGLLFAFLGTLVTLSLSCSDDKTTEPETERRELSFLITAPDRNYRFAADAEATKWNDNSYTVDSVVRDGFEIYRVSFHVPPLAATLPDTLCMGAATEGDSSCVTASYEEFFINANGFLSELSGTMIVTAKSPKLEAHFSCDLSIAGPNHGQRMFTEGDIYTSSTTSNEDPPGLVPDSPRQGAGAP